MTKKIIIGSRGSKLALLYAQNAKEQIIEKTTLGTNDIEIKSISTKGEVTVVISEDNNLKKNFIKLEESDKKKISRLIKKMTIKNIVNEINKDKKFPKKIIYDYCLKIKNENK